ncbi:MAG TPA: sodium:proton antiporter [Bacteroidota bacterium]|nr:sodium:proton antiporter [Bacteroidota bacterium]
MKPDIRRPLTILVILGLGLYALFNILEHEIENVVIKPVEGWLVLPFVLLLGSIAVAPFINRHWWEHNYPKVSYALGAVMVLYYIFVLDNVPRLLLTFHEYVSFISLIGSLFVVAGGIHLRIRGKAAPYENVLLLAFGAVISNFLGTTGASMLLIRPYLRINRMRIKPYHIVFFIFVVSNIGGALTPIGDPPLFLGYLKGVPFFWVITRVWHIWAMTLGILLTVFFVIDWYNFRKYSAEQRKTYLEPDQPEFSGLHNIFFLAVILGSVFISHPIMLRELIMWGAAFASYYTTKASIHEKNEFNFIPIREVAILFAGIFATMIPALDWLELNSSTLGIVTPAQYYWGTGALSSFLDNAPTYLNFLSAAFGLHGASVDNLGHMQAILGISSVESLGLVNPLQPGAFAITGETWRYVQAISVAAVFFGACTYIGNGPNFMVKSIAEQANIEMPSFFGYVVKYTIPVLLPIFAVVWYVYFRQ